MALRGNRFLCLVLGPYLHYKGLLDPPVKMPYWLIYQYLPFYKNIRTVGRLFIYSILGFSMLAAWGMAYLEFQISNFKFQKNKKSEDKEELIEKENIGWKLNKNSKILYIIAGLIIILEFLAVPIEDKFASSFFFL